MSSTDDLTTHARIRLAAVTLFGRQGFSRTTVRQVAAEAGVSAGLVIHHFGSKDGLLAACDDWVIASLREEKILLALGGRMPAMRDYIAEHPEFGAIVDYLVAGLRAGGDMADQVWQRLFTMTLDMLTEAEQQGAMTLPDDREAVAVVMLSQSVGAMLMERQFAATLGGTSLDDPAVVLRYGSAALSLYSTPVFTPQYADALRTSLAAGTSDTPKKRP